MSQVVRAFGPGGPPEANVILKSMPHPVLLVDREMRIEYVNDSAEEFFAASSSMVLGHPLSEIVAFGSPVLALIDQVFERGVSVNEYGVE
ncbi:MAG TPA: two-component sensor histidine kinase, partial [Rhodobiaceae bacterium]|nr:two-component sensor histidine kinase [Rhodobiaceae bacterium]